MEFYKILFYNVTMQISIKKILVMALVFIPFLIDAAVPAPVFKWRNGGYSIVQFNKGMYTSPALLDLNQDGIAEIIWANFKVFAFAGNSGAVLWSFWAGNDRSSSDASNGIGTDTNIAVADINKDGFGEIITAHTNGLLCAYDRNGYFLSGFPLKPMGRSDPIESLSVFDMDNDGYFEIIIGWGSAKNLNVCVVGHDGIVKAGWPQYVPNPNANAMGIYGINIAVGDINRDGFGELVVPSDTGKTCAYFHDGSAVPVSTVFGSNKKWPDVVNYENYDHEKAGYYPNGRFYMGTDFPASIADVNMDGSYEIIIVGGVFSNPTDQNYQELYTTPFIYNLNRTRFKDVSYNWESGLPQSGAPLSDDWSIMPLKRTNPVVVDIDGDNKKEILSSSYDGKMHCYWLDKTEHGNWPFSIYDPAEGVIRFSSEPVVADLDSDGNLEVIFTSWPQYYSNKGGHLFILNTQGALLHKIALPYGDNSNVGELQYDGCLAAPTIGDVDGDGQVEIVLGTVYAGLVVYDLPGSVLGSAPWPTGRHDYARTGWADYISNTGNISVISPNGGESWQAGTTHDITWAGSTAITNVKIELSFNGGSLWSTIIASTPNDGSYMWDIGTTPSLGCVMRISDILGTASDTSDAMFVLTSPPSLTDNYFILPVKWTDTPFGSGGWYVGDYDGDGRSDLLRYVLDGTRNEVLLSTGSAFAAGTNWLTADHGADGWHVGDYNGDGRSDLMRYVPGVSGAQVFLSNGSNFIYSGSWSGAGNGSDGWYIGDFNGDGRDDIMRYVPGVSGADVFLSDGTKFNYSGNWSGAGNGADGWYIGDFNGDGRDDLMRYYPGVSGGEVFLSDGTKFIYNGSWTGAGNGDNGWYLGKFSGTARTDIMRYVLLLSGADVFLNTGSGFTYDGSWTPAGYGDNDWHIGDFNGDGREDLLRAIVGVTGADVLLSTVIGGGATNAMPAAATKKVGNMKWLNDVPANTSLSAEGLAFVEKVKARIAAGEDISIYQIQKEYEKLTGKKCRRVEIMKLLKSQQWDELHLLKRDEAF